MVKQDIIEGIVEEAKGKHLLCPNCGKGFIIWDSETKKSTCERCGYEYPEVWY